MRTHTLAFLIAIFAGIAPAHSAVTERPDGMVLCSAGDTFTLPTAVGRPGRVYRVKNTGTSTCTVATTDDETIDGAATWSVQAGQMISFTGDNGNWLCSQSAAEAKLQRLADLFVVGADTGALTAAEKTEALAQFDAQQTSVANQHGPTGANVTGFMWTDFEGGQHLLCLSKACSGEEHWTRLFSAAGLENVWARSARFGDQGLFGTQHAQGHFQSLYDVVMMPSADLAPDVHIGRPDEVVAGGLNIYSDIANRHAYPNSYSPLIALQQRGGYDGPELIAATVIGHPETPIYRVMGDGTPLLGPSNAFVPRASGGTLTVAGTKVIHRFVSSSSLVVFSEATVDIFVLPGGAGGGDHSWGGGGGAGGLPKICTSVTLTPATYTVTVGAGGLAGEMGNASSLAALCVQGAPGAGGKFNSHVNGYDGVNGGGGAIGVYPQPAAGWLSVAGISTDAAGFPGGYGCQGVGSHYTQDGYNGGGGGGAGAAGVNAGFVNSIWRAGNGGAGIPLNFDGAWRVYGPGGGGGSAALYTADGIAGIGGTGGGGNGAQGDGACTAGAANTGAGGGGSGVNTVAGCAGGSGLVMVSYAAI